MRPALICRAFAAAAWLLFAAQAWGAEEAPDSTRASLAEGEVLLQEGRFEEALSVLRPLTQERVVHADALFLTGLAAIQASLHPEATEDEREALLDEAIAALRRMLIDRPELVRVRLELARAFFFKGEDSLSRQHFERVLASNPPASVTANVQVFLARMRARKRWSARFGFSLAPDSNVGAASESEIIYIFGLPFRRDAGEGARSGVGLIVWGGGEYQYPLQERVRLRMGADVSRREYEGSDFDSTSVSVHLGPRWLIGSASEASLLATAERQWASGTPKSRSLGGRLEFRRQMTQQLSLNGQASWQNQSHRSGKHLDGPQDSFSVGGNWTVSATMELFGGLSYSRERPESEIWRNHTRSVRAGFSVDLPRGFTATTSGQLRWTNYRGSWGYFTPGGATRSDRTRVLRVSLLNRAVEALGFSPQLALVNEERKSNAQLYDYRRNRVELGLQRLF